MRLSVRYRAHHSACRNFAVEIFVHYRGVFPRGLQVAACASSLSAPAAIANSEAFRESAQQPRGKTLVGVLSAQACGTTGDEDGVSQISELGSVAAFAPSACHERYAPKDHTFLVTSKKRFIASPRLNPLHAERSNTSRTQNKNANRGNYARFYWGLGDCARGPCGAGCCCFPVA